ncbi:hypothetical protein C0133_08905, partial [Moraxella catarrhalis]|nr:hypothetical protein [Moraxella catarrhalis]
MGTDVSSGPIFLKQKEEDWQQMLAQGQSSSPKKKERKKEKECYRVLRDWRPTSGSFCMEQLAPGLLYT